MMRTGGFGAGNETRTRDPDLGKVVLYQLSYSRFLERAQILGPPPGKSRNSLSGNPFFRKDSHHRLNRVGITPACTAFGGDESLPDRVIEHPVHGLKVAVDVGKDYGFGMQPELRPGHDLDELV